MLQTIYKNSEECNRFQIVGLSWDYILMYFPILVVESQSYLYSMYTIEDKKVEEAIAHATGNISRF
jgi:hypothetical protein